MSGFHPGQEVGEPIANGKTGFSLYREMCGEKASTRPARPTRPPLLSRRPAVVGPISAQQFRSLDTLLQHPFLTRKVLLAALCNFQSEAENWRLATHFLLRSIDLIGGCCSEWPDQIMLVALFEAFERPRPHRLTYLVIRCTPHAASARPGRSCPGEASECRNGMPPAVSVA